MTPIPAQRLFTAIALLTMTACKPTPEPQPEKEPERVETSPEGNTSTQDTTPRPPRTHTWNAYGKMLRFEGQDRLDPSKTYLILIKGDGCGASRSMEAVLDGMDDLPVEVVKVELSKVESMLSMSTPWLWIVRDGEAVDGQAWRTIEGMVLRSGASRPTLTLRVASAPLRSASPCPGKL